MPERIVAAVALDYETADGKTVIARQGEVINIESEDVERIEAAEDGGGAILVPEAFESYGDYHDYMQAVYRGERGDSEGVARAGQIAKRRQSGGIVGDVDNLTLQERIEEGLNVDETVALAQGDKAKAREVLEAEREATGGEPRKGVEDALSKLIDE